MEMLSAIKIVNYFLNAIKLVFEVLNENVNLDNKLLVNKELRTNKAKHITSDFEYLTHKIINANINPRAKFQLMHKLKRIELEMD